MRVITEKWVADNMFCPVCGQNILFQYENNKPVADFYCSGCMSDFELKSKTTSHPESVTKFTDGAYDTMIRRITGLNNPTFIFMTHNTYSISNLFVVPNYFFTPAIIEKRKPLSDNARRAGWTGCNINTADIPESGKIYIVKDSSVMDRTSVLLKYRHVQPLKNVGLTERGWLADILKCVDKIPNKSFSIKDIYAFENELKTKHPENHFVKEKIRQQLQTLRDKGLLEFSSRGYYRKTI